MRSNDGFSDFLKKVCVTNFSCYGADFEGKQQIRRWYGQCLEVYT